MLKVGDKAPDFTLESDAGEKIALKDLKGKNVVLYFYPKDDTPGCTKEACAFRDDFSQLKKKNAVVLGVSFDNAASHQKFKKKYSLPFPLLVDAEKTLARAYGAYQLKSMYGRQYWGIQRSTFIIGPDGTLKAVFPKVSVTDHNKEVLEALS